MQINVKAYLKDIVMANNFIKPLEDFTDIPHQISGILSLGDINKSTVSSY